MSATVRRPTPNPQRAPRFDSGTSLSADNQGRLVASMHLEGELCPASAPAHAAEVATLLDLGVTALIIDLDDLRLCTSAGLDIWDRAHHRLGQLDGAVHLRGARGVVRRVLDVVAATDTTFAPAGTRS